MQGEWIEAKRSRSATTISYFLALRVKTLHRLRMDVAVVESNNRLNAKDVPYKEWVPADPNPNR